MLRDLIRKLILEIYELEPEDIITRDRVKSDGKFWEWDNAARALGLQSKEQIKTERGQLQSYQARLQSHAQGPQMIKAFQEGKISVCHNPFYSSFAASTGEKSHYHSSLSKWLKKFGSNSKDMLSCVAFTQPIGEAPTGTGVNRRAFTQAMGFYLQGFPVYVNKNDVMSQTLGSLPQGLVKHQQASGIAKRASADAIGTEILGLDWDWAGEVLLDNWKPVGIYINLGMDFGNQPLAEAMGDAMRSALATGLPLYMFDDDAAYGQVHDVNDFLQDMGMMDTMDWDWD
jgi:hypothetical protein